MRRICSHLIHASICTLLGVNVVACGGGETETGPSAPPAFNDKTLATFDLGPQSSTTPFGFELGKGALGFTIHSQFPLHAGYESLKSPNGELVIDKASIPGTDAKFRAYPVFADVTGPYDVLAGVPQSDAASALPPMPGYWEVNLRDQIGTPIALDNVRVLVRFFEGGKFEGGRLDVNALIAGTSTSQDAAKERITAALDGFAGLSLGTINFYSLSTAAEIIDDEEEFRQLLRGAADVVDPEPALNIIFVQNMSKLFAIAKSGGEPGLTAWHGSYIGGLAMETSSDATLDSLALRHEVGHMAGLFHTTEPTDGPTKGLLDALTDTPSCDDTLQLDFCPDSNNLMFPVPNANWSGSISAAQAQVIQGSTLYIGDDGKEVESQTQGHHEGHDLTLNHLRPAFVRADDGSSSPKQAWQAQVATLRPSMRHDLLSVCGRTVMNTASTLPGERQSLQRIAADSTAPNYVRRRASQLLSRP